MSAAVSELASAVRTNPDAFIEERARRRLAYFADRMVHGYIHADHIRNHLIPALEWATETPNARLIVTMPPRHSKSLHVSENLPAWYLGRYPHRRVIGASHTASLAYTFSRRVRNKIADPRWPFPEVQLADDKAAVQSWDTNQGGGYIAVGVGGSPTGHGADCLTGETLISTDRGRVRIDTVSRRMDNYRVATYNHDTGEVEYERIEAARRVESADIWTVRTSSGASFRATGDHRVFVSGRGYRPVRELAGGDEVLCLPGVPQDVHALECGCEQGEATGRERTLLLQGVLAGASEQGGADEAVRPLQRAGTQESGQVLLRYVSHTSPGGAAAGTNEGLSYLQGEVLAQGEDIGVLFGSVQKQGAFGFDDWHGESTVQGRDVVRSVVSGDAQANSGAGWRQVLNLRIDASDSVPPYRRGCYEQQAGKSDYPVPEASQACSCRHDFIVSVEQDCGVPEPVYDIQVAKNRNFFANEVLVHNCIIIDDPIRSAADADSATVRAALHEWYRETMRTRLEPGGSIIITATRWHTDDLTGMLLEDMQHGGEEWRHVHMPAVDDAGEALWPERWPLESLDAIRRSVGSRAWEAQYQGRPQPAEGGMFKRHWWRYWQPRGYNLPPVAVKMPDGETRHVYADEQPGWWDRSAQSWDMTFKETKSGSYVVGLTGATHGVNGYILDRYRDRVEFTGAVQAVRQMHAKHPNVAAKLIEDKANGPAVMDTLRKEIPGIIAVGVDGSKEARAASSTARVEAGNWYLPHPDLPGAEWVNEFINELAAFPQGAHDDQVDAFSQLDRYFYSGASDLSALRKRMDRELGRR